MRTAIATKFVAWEVPSLENLQGNEKKQTEQQPESPHVDFVRSHLIIGRLGLSESKGVKL